MKKIFWISAIIGSVTLLIFSTECTKKESVVIPTISTSPVTNVAATLAYSGGNITSDGGGTITAKGVCWSTNPKPTVDLATKTSDGSGTGLFTSSITGLTSNTQYYVRSYATNSAGTAYGSDVIFTTTIAVIIPTITTTAVSSITNTTATSGGNITSDGGAAITARGVCWSTNPNPTIDLTTKTSDGTGSGTFTSYITSLNANTQFHVRSYATNSAGTAYGLDVIFTTTVAVVIPTITTASVSSITNTTATSGGNITSDGGGAITARGVCWGTNPNPTIDLTTKTSDGTGSGTFTSYITSLNANTQFHVRSYATNSAGTAYGLDVIFTTTVAVVIPTITTASVSSITNTTATSGGNITSDGGAAITARGVCWSTNPNPTIDLTTKTSDGMGSGTFTSYITSLNANTQFHVRSYATNSAGTAYGLDVIFTTTVAVVIPTITTASVSSITNTTATSGGNITSDGGGAITARGVCWGTNPNPTIDLTTKTSDGTGSGTFTSYITGLNANTQFHVRSYATNSAGTAYGLDVIFTTTVAVVIPTITTASVSSITNTTATSGGNITSDGGAAITARGVCWSTNPNPTIDLTTKTSDGTGSGTFTSYITGLNANTQYHIRSYATNSAGTAYGLDVIFTTTVAVVIPTITTTSVSSIANTTATSGGNITSDGGGAIAARGVCWSTNPNPTIALTSKTSDGTGTGIFSSNITGLTANTQYHIRSYATNSAGTAYGSDVIFSTTVAVVIPTITTTSVSSIANTTATSGGNITSDGGDAITARGVCWSTNPNPTIALTSKTSDGTGTGIFSSNITGLTANTQYHIRSYATNSAGTAYGSDVIFSTTVAVVIPTITTTSVSSIANTTATSGGNITSDGGGAITARGVCWSTNPNPTIALTTKTSDGTGTGIFSSNITGLTANTQYHIRSYATNSAGTAYGSDVIFSTTVAIVIPTITTTSVSSIKGTSAKTGGNIISDGGATITARGICWSTSQNPTIDLPTKTFDGTGVGSFSSTITGLSANTGYFVRAYASNSVGTSYGSQLNFTTNGTIIDIEGNMYNTITIGTQLWMAENLKTTIYNDNTSIPLITDNTEWSGLTTPAYCWYGNDATANKDTYGALYNWYSINTAKICPIGWHVPDATEWTTLITYLGGENAAGPKMKENSAAQWANSIGTNESGFTALPGGSRKYNDGTFTELGVRGSWWSTLESTGTGFYRFIFSSSLTDVYGGQYNDKRAGYSVRCLKN
jgi:uncharacterized protein (TIGR02145 family)